MERGLLVNDAGDKWEFEIDQFMQGDSNKMQTLQVDFSKVPLWERFLAIESQGQGRALKKFVWKMNDERKYIIECTLDQKAVRRNPHNYGLDIAFHFLQKDITFSDGDFKTVTGIDSAIQGLQLVLSSRPGDYADHSPIGSHFSECCDNYRDNLSMLK